MNSQTTPLVRFSFTNGNLFNDQNTILIKAYNASFVKDRFGNPRSACYLQGGEGSYLNLGTTSALKPVVGSISIWINIAHEMLHGIGVETNPILSTRAQDRLDHNEAFFIGYDFATDNLNVNTTLSKEHQITIYSNNVVKLREWHHAVMTYDDNYLCFYLDGVLQAKLPKKFRSEFLASDSVLVGNLNNEKNRRFFNGAVDDIEFFSKVLNEEEVLNLYNAPDPNKNHIILRWFWIGVVVVAFLLLVIWMIRKRVKHLVKVEAQRNLMELNALEQEIKTLKAQMDPHFIFNSMNTILQFIITKQNDKAEIYLAKFSKLIRTLLESNTNEGISLTDEIDILKRYLEIESLRFDQIIETHIEVKGGIDSNTTYIPHMMIQPFVENSIWHGLRLKEGQRKLYIKFEKKDDKTLFCIIEDNGIGRNNSENSIEKEHRSLAINFIQQRLELMSKRYDRHYSLNIIDKVNEANESLGTLIEITLPIIPR